jgi:hypothetical protein
MTEEMAERLLEDEYKTPLAMVRGVFLCEEIAVKCSVLTIEITQDNWSPFTNIGVGVSDTEDIWLEM